jgi:hypothetical protein
MAYEGELVRMENGRWARFQLCTPCGYELHSSILVAVELDDRFQDLLNAAEGSIESYRDQNIQVDVRLGQGADGNPSVLFERREAVN